MIVERYSIISNYFSSLSMTRDSGDSLLEKPENNAFPVPQAIKTAKKILTEPPNLLIYSSWEPLVHTMRTGINMNT